MEADPLWLVRQATMTGAVVNYSEGFYIFGTHRFHGSTKTCFKRSMKSQEDFYYTLRDIIFFLENVETPVAEYRRNAMSSKLTAVIEQDKTDLKNYLTGAIESCPQIDFSLLSRSLSASAAPAAMTTASSFAAVSSSTFASVTSSGQKLQKSAQLQHQEAVVVLTAEQLLEQRTRNAQWLDQAVLSRSSELTGGSSTAGALGDLKTLQRSMKRKHSSGGGETSLQSSDVAGNLDRTIDKNFVALDRRLLAACRRDETTAAQTRTTVLRAHNADFHLVLKLFNDRVLKPKDGNRAPTDLKSPGDKQVVRGVIAVNPTSAISMVNIREFLVDGMFVPSEEKRKEPHVKAERMTIISRSLPADVVQMYKIVDDPLKLAEADWAKVVAVFVTGQLWQFKNWNNNQYSSPVTLFQNVLGVHLVLDDRGVDPVIQSWNCKVLKVNKFKQHQNAGASREFWTYLDDFVRVNKPALIGTTAPSQLKKVSNPSGGKR
eukprot:gene22673-30954_t